MPRFEFGPTDNEIWTILVHRDRLHALEEPARDAGSASVGMALPDDLDADWHAFDRQHRHGYGGSSKDRSRAIEHRIPSATEAVRSRPGRAEADQRVGQWGNRGEPVIRLLALQQA